ncbi:MAG TPA: hypothetical protein PLD20_25310 [Blastocatellia bacterium]|nr:hypothetical protein [Blastocatellia bacterium]HMZ21277.1 hypothetical protein [Blastocatellia bacterium]HNG30758.1 hypothetical protein [Blastocatellia bacterium]
MHKLHQRWGAQVQFVDVIVRQAHPGPGMREYRSEAEKMRDAEKYQRENHISWPVLVDDLRGTTHQVYGMLADPIYLIDADGRVAFYNLWAHAPTLHVAITALLQRGGRGVVNGGTDRMMHMAAALTDGWKGLRKGLWQSLTDIETAAPGLGVGAWLEHQIRPLLAPITLRAEPLPPAAKAGLTVGALALAACTVWWLRREPRRPAWQRALRAAWH